MHYNNGAVWPFVTGFVSWGQYRARRPWSGYPRTPALAQMTFDWARGRHPELLSGAFYRPLDTAVPHQFFATSMLLSPIMYGLLGWEPDAPAGRARLAPPLPPSWDRGSGRPPPRWERVSVRHLRVGSARLTVQFERGSGRATATVSASAPLNLEFAQSVPAGARGGAGVLVFGAGEDGWTLVVEGTAARRYEIALVGERLGRVEGADLVRRQGEVTTIAVVLPAGPGRQTQTVKLAPAP